MRSIPFLPGATCHAPVEHPSTLHGSIADWSSADGRAILPPFLDYRDVRSVRFVVNNHQLRIAPTTAATSGLSGRACASSPELLGQLQMRQERQNDQLLITLERTGSTFLSWFGTSSAYLDLQAGVPEALPVEVIIGSGDAWVTGIQTLSAQIGSGDLDAREIPGAVSVMVGSGDAKLYEIGTLQVDAIGSGDLIARDVRGTVSIGNLGSGDLALKGVTGDVKIGSIGSGDAKIERVAGNLTVGSIGSGDVEIERVRGNVTVGSIGSGDLEVEDISGNLTVRNKGSGSIHHQRVRGTVEIPRRR